MTDCDASLRPPRRLLNDPPGNSAPFPAFCFLIKILAKSLSISMSATVSSRQYYPKHNLILNVQLRPELAGEWEVGAEQTGGSLRVAHRSVLHSNEVVVWVFGVSPRWDTGNQRGGKPGLGHGGCHPGLCLPDLQCGGRAEGTRWDP